MFERRKSFSQRSRFITSFLWAFFQSFLSHRKIHDVIPWTTYFESVTTLTLHGILSASKALITAVSSIRLFVVRWLHPESSFSFLLALRITPYPPTPGLPLQAPSVNISTDGLSPRFN